MIVKEKNDDYLEGSWSEGSLLTGKEHTGA